jgi:hypothetical protein
MVVADPAAARLPGAKRFKLPPNPSSTKLAYEREFSASALHLSAPHVTGHMRAKTNDTPAASSSTTADMQVCRL